MPTKYLVNALAKEDTAQFEAQKTDILALLNFPSSEAVDILLHVIQNYENPILIKLSLTVLSEMDNQDAVTVLTHCMFEHEQRVYRGDAARALGYSRSQRAILPLKRLLKTPPEAATDLPISEGLWAVMSLCQAGILPVDEDWTAILALWQAQEAEFHLMARIIIECFSKQEIAISS